VPAGPHNRNREGAVEAKQRQSKAEAKQRQSRGPRSMVTWSKPHQVQVQGANHATGFVVGLVRRGSLLLAGLSIHSVIFNVISKLTVNYPELDLKLYRVSRNCPCKLPGDPEQVWFAPLGQPKI